jgi:hypothetical protein
MTASNLPMHADHAAAAPLSVPPELLAELKRRPARGHDFQVEGWKPNLFERLMGKLTGRR